MLGNSHSVNLQIWYLKNQIKQKKSNIVYQCINVIHVPRDLVNLDIYKTMFDCHTQVGIELIFILHEEIDFEKELLGTATPLHDMGHDKRKLVFWVSDKVRFKPACLATETS